MKNNTKILNGSRILLRPLERKDITRRYLSWVNDKKVTRYMESGYKKTSMEELFNYYRRISRSKDNQIFAIIDKKSYLHIGNVKLGNIDWRHRYADLGIMIGDKNYWGKGIAAEVCNLVLDYSFKKLNLNKVILGVYSNHKRAIGAYKKAGFKIEGRIKRLFLFNKKRFDKIIMGILKSEYKK